MAKEYAIVINVELTDEDIEELIGGDGSLYDFMFGTCQDLFGDFDLRIEEGAM